MPEILVLAWSQAAPVAASISFNYCLAASSFFCNSGLSPWNFSLALALSPSILFCISSIYPAVFWLLPNERYLAKPFSYHRASKNCIYDLHISKGVCGEDDFRCPFLNNAILPPEKAMGHKVCWTSSIISAYSPLRHLQGLQEPGKAGRRPLSAHQP